MKPRLAYLLSLAAISCSSLTWADEAAYILLYHHVARDTPAATSVTPEQFAVQMNYLAEQDYHVVPLEKIMLALRKGKTLKPRSVAITFDDGYRSVIDNALPILDHRNWPFTVFVSTDAIDGRGSGFITWDELRALEKKGATVANHSRSHAPMLQRRSGESAAGWRQRVSVDITAAQQRLDAELHRPARLLAYPFGEFDAQLVDLVEELGFLALGQQSGPVGAGVSPYATPRFPISTGYHDLESFAEKLQTRPLPVSSPALPATLLQPDVGTPELSLTIEPGPFRLNDMACFVAGQPAEITWQDRAAGRATVVGPAAAPVGRSKTTCTAPHETERGVYYWYTHLWMKPRRDGSWYEG